MTERVVDLEQRRTAISPDASFLVQAPAGSGKTELLIQRYLRLLAAVDAPEEIVAITFTRKAAAEMRGRIIDALERVMAEEEPPDEAARQTLDLAAAAMARNRELGWQLEHSPGRLRIQTIDSLCGALTRQMPVLSGFGAQPEIVEDAGELYRQAAADTLADLEGGSGWSPVIAVLLGHLDNDLPRVRTMLAGMLARRDQWLRHLENGIRREELEAALRHVVESGLETAAAALPADSRPELVELLGFAAANLEREGRESAVRACRGLTELSPRAGALPQWQGLAALLLKSDGGWRQSVNARDGFPAAGDKTPDADRRAAMKDRFKALVARLSEVPALRRHLQAVRELPPPAYSEPDWLVVQALCQLLKLADAKLRALFAERNQIDFTGVGRAALDALGGEESPTDLALSLDYRIRHILVDEFQDISVSQYTLLQRLTAGWSPGDGHTLFLVGDPMQSIYRFREAEVGLFLNTWDEQRLEQVAITPLNISVNFRSRSGIVDWVNETFARVLPEEADVGRGAVNHTPAVAYHDHPDREAVSVHPLLGRDEDREAARVLALIRQARETDPGGSIAVLVRSRSHLAAIVPQLKQAGLRFRAVEIEPLGSRPAIQDLMALTRALHHFDDRVAWLAILRAPWCGLTLADLLQLAGDPSLSVWECLQRQDRLAALDEAARQRAVAVREVLETVLAQRQRLSLSRWVESAWLRLGGPATLRDANDLENSATYFRLLDRFDDGGDLKDRDGFLQQVEELYAAADAGADANLQIMTIHKAKGLEFDTVIVPGMERGSRSDENRLLRWAESPHRDHQDLLLAPVQEAGDNASPVYDFLKRLEKEKQSYEDGRLLYVAATRARRRLHLIGSLDIRRDEGGEALVGPRADSLLAQLWPVVEQEFRAALGGQREAPEAAAADENRPAPLRRLVGGWTLPAAPAAAARPQAAADAGVDEERAAIEFDWAGEAIRHIGTVVHRCVQRIADDGLAAWDADRIRAQRDRFHLALKRLGLPGEELTGAVAAVEEALVNMIDDERGRWLLDDGHADARNEYAVSGVHDGRLVNVVIDRTFVDSAGTRWIVDYKTSRHRGGRVEDFLDREQERYREQLQRYAALLGNMEARPTRLGLYFPLLRAWREWDGDS